VIGVAGLITHYPGGPPEDIDPHHPHTPWGRGGIWLPVRTVTGLYQP
jgi:hypothetical protein